jgi:hypothetical protein
MVLACVHLPLLAVHREWGRLPQSTKHLARLAWKDPNAVGETI